MAYEDFTSYIENDPNNWISILLNQITYNGQPRNQEGYVYSDKGAGHFTDYTHYIDLIVTNNTNARFILANLTNSIDDAKGIYDGAQNEIWIDIYQALIRGYSVSGGGVDGTDFYNSVVNTRYYLKYNRNDTTYTIWIYSDATHLNLLDTLSFTCNNTAYRYIFAVNSWKDGNATVNTLNIYNLDLQETPAPTGSIKIPNYFNSDFVIQ